MTKVLAISGSLRKSSYNGGLLQAAAEHAAGFAPDRRTVPVPTTPGHPARCDRTVELDPED